MPVIIRNLGRVRGGVYRYEVRINDSPPIACFQHKRKDGLAKCLERAAAAVKASEMCVLGATLEAFVDA